MGVTTLAAAETAPIARVLHVAGAISNRAAENRGNKCDCGSMFMHSPGTYMDTKERVSKTTTCSSKGQRQTSSSPSCGCGAAGDNSRGFLVFSAGFPRLPLCFTAADRIRLADTAGRRSCSGAEGWSEGLYGSVSLETSTSRANTAAEYVLAA
jgi:hypothetical protein